jgi:hypothetical protein
MHQRNESTLVARGSATAKRMLAFSGFTTPFAEDLNNNLAVGGFETVRSWS